MRDAVDRHVFYISDDTAITVEMLGHAVISQFPVAISSVTLPFAGNTSRVRAIKGQIDTTYWQTSIRPLVFYSIVIPEIHDIVLQSEDSCQDIVQTPVVPLQQELNLGPTPMAHCTHSLNPGNLIKYNARTATIDYTLAHDDGISLCNLDQAQVTLLDVSRCGRTLTSLCLAMRYGIRAANYPFTADDMDNLVLSVSLKSLQHKVFGLTTNPERLAAIREERRENNHYASLRRCRMEVTEVETLYRRNKIPCLNSTNYSAEEITTKIVDIMGLNRRMYQHTSTLLEICLYYHPRPIQDHALLLQ